MKKFFKNIISLMLMSLLCVGLVSQSLQCYAVDPRRIKRVNLDNISYNVFEYAGELVAVVSGYNKSLERSYDRDSSQSQMTSDDYTVDSYKDVDVDFSRSHDCVNPKSSNWLEIPGNIEYEGKSYRVISIGKEAFKNCILLQAIKVPDSVFLIEEQAFYNSNIEYFVGNGVKYIKSFAFYRCNYLKEVCVSRETSYIGREAFAECESLENFVYSAVEQTSGFDNYLLTLRPDDTRTRRYGKELIDIPQKRKLEKKAFKCCTSLRRISLPPNLEFIKSETFLGCINLSEVIIPENVIYIDFNLFCDCRNLEKLYISEDFKSEEYKLFLFSDLCINVEIEWQEKSLKQCKLSGKKISIDGVVMVDDVFYGCQERSRIAFVVGYNEDIDITSIHEQIVFNGVEYNVKAIADGAFSNCRRLSNFIELPMGLEIIGNGAFYNCENLERVQILGVKAIGEGAFLSCHNLKAIRISQKLLVIEHHAFYCCRELELIQLVDIRDGSIMYEDVSVIPENVRVIERCSFQNTGLKNLIISHGVKLIGESAFEGCKDIEHVHIEGSVISIGKRSFANCTGIESLIIREGVKYIRKRAFLGCRSIYGLSLPNGVIKIGREAFSGCESLRILEMGRGIEKISNGAFASCRSLEKLKFVEDVVDVGETIFCDCESLFEAIVFLQDSIEDFKELRKDNPESFNSLPGRLSEDVVLEWKVELGLF